MISKDSSQRRRRREQQREWSRTHPRTPASALSPDELEARRARHRKHHWANREARLADHRKYLASHRDEQVAYRLATIERYRAYQSAYQRDHPEMWVASNNRRRALKAGSGGSHTSAEWIEKRALLGNVCFYCGRAGPLTRDHKVPLSRGGR